MDVKSFRAPTLQEALRQVRRELGPDAAVLHTRELPADRWWHRLSGRRQIEIMASNEVNVPSRLAGRGAAEEAGRAVPAASFDLRGRGEDATARGGRTLPGNWDIEQLREMLAAGAGKAPAVPREMFHLYAELVDAELPADLAGQLIEGLRQEAPREEWGDPASLRLRLARRIEGELPVAGPICPAPGRCHVVALVGPTGVGKTTTIAKLAAHFRLREKLRVGLITVDTYRIAAVEQLRTYADIIDLPMDVVSTPREMRLATGRLAGLDLVLIDTAGRSPKDDVRIQELRALLQEAQPHEVHLVLSSTASAPSLAHTAARFAPVGVTSLVLTKLDEAAGLGALYGFVRGQKLPLSYVTHGQNVPDDIEAAESRRLALSILEGRLSLR